MVTMMVAAFSKSPAGPWVGHRESECGEQGHHEDRGAAQPGGPAAPAWFGGQPACQHQQECDRGGQADEGGYQVHHAVHGGGGGMHHADRVSGRGVLGEDAGGDHAEAGDGLQDGGPGGAAAGSQRGAQGERETDEDYPEDDEVGHLDPAPGPEAQCAHGLAQGVIAGPDGAGDPDGGVEQQASDQGASQQGAVGARAGRDQVPGGAGAGCRGGRAVKGRGGHGSSPVRVDAAALTFLAAAGMVTGAGRAGSRGG